MRPLSQIIPPRLTRQPQIRQFRNPRAGRHANCSIRWSPLSAGRPGLLIRTVEQQGRSYSFFQGRPSSAGTLFWRFYEYPDKERRELTKQRDVVYIYNGDKGYEKTFKGTAADEDKTLQEVLRRRQHSLEVGCASG